MDSPAVNIMDYELWPVWTLFTPTPAAVKSPAFAITPATEAVLETLFSDALLEFAPGHLDVLISTDPPTVAYFNSLPRDAGQRC